MESEKEKIELMLDFVSKAVPVDTAYGAAGIKTHEFKHWKSVPENAERLEMARKSAEARLFMDMMALGATDWKCKSQALERINPAQYAKPETQALLRQADNDAKAIGMEIMKWLQVAEERHSGHDEVIKDAIVSGGDAPAPAPTEQIEFSAEDENPYDG